MGLFFYFRVKLVIVTHQSNQYIQTTLTIISYPLLLWNLFACMSILYLDIEKVCLVDDKLEEVFYTADKKSINYSEFATAVKVHKHLKIFINSFFTFSEYKNFATGTLTQHRKTIDTELAKKEVLFGNYNNIFEKGKGLLHANDVIINKVIADANEAHIKKVFDTLYSLDVNISNTYLFVHAVQSIGVDLTAKTDNHLNISLFTLEEGTIVIVSNGKNFLFGRLVRRKLDETTTQSAANILETTLKHVGTTFEFLTNPACVKIFTTVDIDQEELLSSSPFFNGIDLSIQQLSLETSGIKHTVPDIADELGLAKMALKNLKNVKKLESSGLKKHIALFFTIRCLFVAAIAIACGVLFFASFRLIGSNATKNQLERSRFELSTQQAQYNKQKKILERLSSKILLTIASKISNPHVNNNHIDTIRDIAEIFKKYRGSTYVEGYKFSCTDCTAKVRKNTLELDVAFFNQTSSAKFVLQNIDNLKNEITQTLKKTYTNVDISFKEINDKDKQRVAKRDIRDKMTILYYGDMTVKEETSSGEDNNAAQEEDE